MRNRLLGLFALLVFLNNMSFAQISGTNCYIKGRWLEIGLINNASFGTQSAPPAGYHPHGFTGIGEVYDYGHDGWGTGAPPYMGDYTLPGSPFEGWELQYNGLRNQAYEFGGYNGSCAPCGTLGASGALTYTNTGSGVSLCDWNGTASAGSLVIRQETEIDTNSSWVVVTTKFYNTSGASIPNVYYLRTCDPDNDESWGGSFFTTNYIQFQNDALHRVLVTATGNTGAYTRWGLGTKDPRAVAFIYSFWPLSGSTDLATIYNKTYTPADYTLHTSDNGDIGIGLVYYMCSIPAHDSAVISYAYIFGSNSSLFEIDSAFPEPMIVVNDSFITSTSRDTFNACNWPDSSGINLNVASTGTTRSWAWTHWTWTPATGLSSTTGSEARCTFADLSGPTTYTVVGLDTDYCRRDTTIFIFTILPCASAQNNSPCYGNALDLTFVSDDTAGASYFWYGPGGFTSVLRNPVIYPATFADSGYFYCVKIVGTLRDTFATHVIIHPLPEMDMFSNMTICGPMYDSLLLGISPDSVGETFSWTGPNGFTSSLEFPMINPFDSIDQGIYSVTAVTRWGCVNIGSIDIFNGIVPTFTFDRHYGCYFDTVYFTNTTTNADTYSWNFGDGSPTNSNRNCFHVYSTHDMFNVTLHCTNEHCDSSVTIPVDLRHTVKAIFSPIPDTFCAGQSTTCMDSSYSYLHYGFKTLYSNVWNFGDGTTDASYSPTHTYPLPGIYPITVVATDSIGCEDSITKNVYVLLLHLTGFTDTTLCISQPLPMANVLTVIPDISLVYSYMWSPGIYLSDSTVEVPNFFGLGLYTYTLTASVVPYGCPATQVITINSVLGKVLTNVTATSTISLGSSIQLNADSETIYWWKPNDGSLDNPNINNPIATPTHTTLYTVYGYDVNGCLDSAYVDIIVDSTMEEEIPGAFTPNGDGLNDVFKPIGEKFQSMVEFRVYNRWGQQMFYSNNFNQGWDGTYNGVPQELGVYFYTVTVARPGGSGDNIVYKGEVTLIR